MEMQIKLSFGAVQVEYEGTEEYFSSAIPGLLEKLVALASAAPAVRKATVPSDSPNGQVQHESGLDHSTNTVARLLNAQTGPDLIMAAVAKLIIVGGADKVTRSQITAEMRSASAFYKKTYTNNLSKYLETLTKADQLRLMGDNLYGLPNKQREQIEARLHE
jgi:hypothetical protein